MLNRYFLARKLIISYAHVNGLMFSAEYNVSLPLSYIRYCSFSRTGKSYRGGKQFNGKRGRHSDSSEKGANKTQKVEAAA